jgi:wobble nucleotide-excising tRNase
MREHGPAADIINSMVHRYLGHNELEIIALDQGYRIQRAGKPLTGSLSEGEKTAIAFCYFLSTLEAEGRRIKDLIVVLDDPISSLDTRSLNYCVSTVKATFRSSAQLFILTHNINFMNEIKKWFKSKEGKSCILFINTEISEINNSR